MTAADKQTLESRPAIRVAVGVIRRADGAVLMGQRPAGSHLAGCWEFPGGKLEPGESVRAALDRELDEELGIQVRAAQPLIRTRHAYAERDVTLDTWTVTAFDGEPHGREGQPLAWIDPAELGGDRWPLPPADAPILAAIRLPERYAITPADLQAAELEAALDAGQRLFQLRGLHSEARLAAISRIHARGGRVLVNGDIDHARTLPDVGLHLRAEQLAGLAQRPIGADRWLAASCHNAAELARAAKIGCDFAVLGPVEKTPSHPEAEPLGWARLAELVDGANLPVYALGGLTAADLDHARAAGCQGIAAIRSAFGRAA